MDCKYTCFDRVIYLIKKLPSDKITEAIRFIQELSFEDFLDFCVENGCFTQEQAKTLFDFIIVWEDLDGNYFEEDKEKLLKLYDSVGINEEIFKRLCC